MLVFADGRTVGTIGGGCYEHDAFWKAREALKTRRAEMVHYELSDEIAEESGLICGGQMDVFIEPIEPAPRLYLIGGGHVGHQLGQVAPTVGFRLHVIDDRSKFANHDASRLPRRSSSSRRPSGPRTPKSPPAPLSSSSRAGTGRTSTCSGRSPDGSSATSG